MTGHLKTNPKRSKRSGHLFAALCLASRALLFSPMIHVAQPPSAGFADSRFSGHSRGRLCHIFRRKTSHE